VGVMAGDFIRFEIMMHDVQYLHRELHFIL
jgi:hypothetical protein